MIDDAFMEAWIIRSVPVKIFEITDFADSTRRLTTAWHADLRPEVMARPDCASVTIKRG
jgi:hypothetical protein